MTDMSDGPYLRPIKNWEKYSRQLIKVGEIELEPSAEELAFVYRCWKEGCPYQGLEEDYQTLLKVLKEYNGKFKVEFFRPPPRVFQGVVEHGLQRFLKRGVNPVELLLLRNQKPIIGPRVIVGVGRKLPDPSSAVTIGITKTAPCLDFRGEAIGRITRALVDYHRKVSDVSRNVRTTFWYAAVDF